MLSVMISVCILTKNAARSIEKTLDSTRLFSEVILLDNGSTDATLTIASQYPNVSVHHSPFIGFGPLRNKAASLASHDWILALDSDEVLSAALIQELMEGKFDPNYAYAVERHNFYNGKRIRGCGWDKEFVARLYHRKHLSYCQSEVHESLQCGPTISLSSPLFHTPYLTAADFLSKMHHYATLFAKEYKNKKNSSFAKALAHGSYAFFRSYILKKGIFCGKEGFIICWHNANTTFYKYLLLAEENRRDSRVGFFLPPK
jgi:glycosyltransferase involved in cell wall biosynthesis